MITKSEYPRAQARARQLIDEFGIRRPSDIDLVALAAAMNVFIKSDELKGSQARLVRTTRGGVIRVAETIKSVGQKNFCVAHELGHFLLHATVDQLSLCTSQDLLPGYRRRPEEPEANGFAAELLMPEEMFAREVGGVRPGLEILENLSSTFNATLSAVALRYVEVAQSVCAVVLSENGKIRWSKPGDDFGFRIHNWGSRLDGRTCAADLYRNGHAEKVEEDVPAVAWLEDERVEEHWTIREIMVPMPKYNSVLSLLWVASGSELDKYDPDGGTSVGDWV